MEEAAWNRYRGIIAQYRHGKISRSRFALEWTMARRESGLAECGTAERRAPTGQKITAGGKAWTRRDL
ncbi:MAG: hypothetical protein FWD94_07810 [Treponema sp.]|nr:hypothetical protein [Treponema sp.]